MTITTPQSRNHFATHGHHRLSYELITPAPTEPSDPTKPPTETVVLLHSLLAGRVEFAPLRGLLTTRFRLLLPDARGHGASAAIPDQRYTIPTAASELDAILDAAGERHVHLLGHDLGGAIAIAFALVRPQRLRSLTLIDPALMNLLADDPDSTIAALHAEALRADTLAADTAYKGVTDRAIDQYVSPRFGPDWRATAPKPLTGAVRRHATALAGALFALNHFGPDPEKLRDIAVPTTIFTTTTARPLSRHINLRLAGLLPASTRTDLPGADPDDAFRSPLSGAAAATIADSLLALPTTG